MGSPYGLAVEGRPGRQPPARAIHRLAAGEWSGGLVGLAACYLLVVFKEAALGGNVCIAFLANRDQPLLGQIKCSPRLLVTERGDGDNPAQHIIANIGHFVFARI